MSTEAKILENLAEASRHLDEAIYNAQTREGVQKKIRGIAKKVYTLKQEIKHEHEAQILKPEGS